MNRDYHRSLTERGGHSESPVLRIDTNPVIRALIRLGIVIRLPHVWFQGYNKQLSRDDVEYSGQS